MKVLFLRFLPVWAGLLCLPPAGVAAPAADPAAPKPPVHKPEQSALNRLKQDERSKKQLAEAADKLREAGQRQEAAGKELKRIKAKDLQEDPAKVIESVKEKLTPGDSAALKEAMEKAKEALGGDEAKKLLEEAKKKAGAALSTKGKKSGAAVPGKFGPSTFDQVPPPVPAETPGAAPAKRRNPGFFVTGDTIIFPPTQDPAHPDRALPPQDPRSRTYVVTGTAQVKTPSMVLEGDRIEMLASADGGGEGFAGLTAASPPPAPKAKPAARGLDPVQPGAGVSAGADKAGTAGDNAADKAGDKAGDKKAAPFDRVIATGRVNIVRIENGKTQSGKGGSMIYDKQSGNMVLTDWPEAQEGNNVIVGTRQDAKIVLVPNGKSYSEGCTVRDLGDPKAERAPAAAATPPRAQPAQ